jgi:hypothetical protein
MLVTAPVFADVRKVSVEVSKHAYADDSGPKDSLAVKVKVHIFCHEQTDLGSLTISLVLIGPDGKPVDLVPTASRTTNAACGMKGFAFDFHDVLNQTGWYTLYATAKINGLSSSASVRFDPTSEGGPGPPG